MLLQTILKPLAAHYEDPQTIELRMGRAGVVIVERREQGKFEIDDHELDVAQIEKICQSLANLNGLKFDPDDAPKVSCVLPQGHRFECLVGSSVQTGLSLAIRCKHPFTPTWKQVGAGQAVEAWLTQAVALERNIIVSGATNTGKTTLLNMLLAVLPVDRRVIAAEDTPELHMVRFWNGVGLLAAREAVTAAGRVSWRELYDHMMRITPDHIVFGEISTQNAFAALAALNSGVTGFMCTIHAESPEQAIHRKFDQNIAWAGETMPRVPEFLSELVDVVVQIKRNADGWRRISDIYEPRLDRYVLKDGEPMALEVAASGLAA
jgi:pilus assembly protein CpaF